MRLVRERLGEEAGLLERPSERLGVPAEAAVAERAASDVVAAALARAYAAAVSPSRTPSGAE